MTDKEKAIVMAYTGIAMLTGDKFDIFHKYVEEIMRRPVFTHEFATCAEEIKERAKPDFLKLCAEDVAEWIDRSDGGRIRYQFCERYECSKCGAKSENTNFCPNCGADMRQKEGEANENHN